MENTINILEIPEQDSKFSHYITGYKIPSFPKTSEPPHPKGRKELYKKFVQVLRSLHHPNSGVSISLVISAIPNPSNIVAEINFYILIRVTGNTLSLRTINVFANQIINSIPNDSLLGFGTPIAITENEIKSILLLNPSDSDKIRQFVEIYKHEESLIQINNQFPNDFPNTPIFHPFKSTKDEPWLDIIELLGRVENKTSIQVSLEPIILPDISKNDEILYKYKEILDLDSSRLTLKQIAAQQSNLPYEKNSNPNPLGNIVISDYFKIQKITSSQISFFRRAKHSYQRLLAFQNELYRINIIIMAEIKLDPAIANTLSGILADFSSDTEEDLLGWHKPEIIISNQDALYKFQKLGYSTNQTPKDLNLQNLVTCEEASILFHLPTLPIEYNNSAIIINESPFFIPPGLFNKKPGQSKQIKFGRIYQKDILTDLYFSLPLSDLPKPSILVGAPGSVKSNLALSILSQIWDEYQTPFLVIDPTTGHEYRYLLTNESLEKDLIVFTCGDEETTPFRFNPLEIPFGVTVRSHITRLLSCFKAAYEMWDPLPAIYEAALFQLYTSEKFGWDLDDRGQVRKESPTMQDYFEAINYELEVNVLPDFGKGTEAAGILTGSSKIRIGGIINSLGHILNVKSNSPEFFQKLLKRPVVIELGDIGDPNNIALVMAFLVIQLIGHFEYAYQNGERDDHIHLLLIEEAHRLLSAEAGSNVSLNQGNTRGKSAEDINNLLAEVRKFKQGIMVLDQRPSSLVGGVLDNTLINIMCRLNDKTGFEHLSNVLNLNPNQQKYARTRLVPGDTVMLDRSSGQPVLIRSDKILDNLRDDYFSRIKPDEKNILSQNIIDKGLNLPLKVKESFVDNKTEYNNIIKFEDWFPVIDTIGQDIKNEIISSLSNSSYNDGLDRKLNSWMFKPQVRKEINELIKRKIIEIIAYKESIPVEKVNQLFQ